MGAGINKVYSCNTVQTGVAGSVRDEQIFVKRLVLMILYPSLRVEFSKLKGEIVGDLPPRTLGPLRVKAEHL